MDQGTYLKTEGGVVVRDHLEDRGGVEASECLLGGDGVILGQVHTWVGWWGLDSKIRWLLARLVLQQAVSGNVQASRDHLSTGEGVEAELQGPT